MINYIYHIHKPTVVLFMLISVVLVAILEKRIPKIVFRIMVFISLFGILYCTLYRASSTSQEINWIPFSTFEEAKELVELYIGLLMNVFLFFPLGLFLPYCLKKHPVLKTVLFGLLISVCIEYLQYKFSLGKAEVDDVIMNVLGAFTGSLSIQLSNYLDKKEVVLCIKKI